MSAAEEATVQPTETKPVEAPVSTEPVAESSSAAVIVPETAPEAALLSKDPITVADNLEKADPVTTEAIASSTLAAAETTAPEEATASESAPATPEKHKEGSNLLKFMKKYVPNPKGGVEKKTPALAGSGKAVVHPTDAPAKTDEITPVAEPPVIVEPTEEESFDGGNLQFKAHGGIFGYLPVIYGANNSGGWKSRSLLFGKEDPYGHNALLPFVTTHKLAAYALDSDKINAAWENAAHASVTGVGLLFLTKTKALDIPLSIINLVRL
jgi:hypothetical protein